MLGEPADIHMRLLNVAMMPMVRTFKTRNPLLGPFHPGNRLLTELALSHIKRSTLAVVIDRSRYGRSGQGKSLSA
jgi:hypothetical protein